MIATEPASELDRPARALGLLGWLGLAWLALAGFGWLEDFGWISIGFPFDSGFGWIWLDSGLA